MLVGCVLVVIVLLLFLFDWRCAIISATAIPLSLLAAVLVLYYRGGTDQHDGTGRFGDRTWAKSSTMRSSTWKTSCVGCG